MAAEQIKEAMANGAEEINFDVASVVFELVRIPEGTFFMGSPLQEEGRQPIEGPMRAINLSKPFYMGRYAITQAQYQVVTGMNPSSFRGETLAMDQVLYSDALEFCSRLSQLSGIKVTLPTEAQWEYACRAGAQTRFYSGDSIADLDAIGWYVDNSGERVHEVGQKDPNAWGLYDMSGNVWEPTLDWLPSYETMANTDPVGSITERGGAMRGGGRMHEAQYCRSASRLRCSNMFGGMGIRIVINPDG
ncbi:MAG: formylglycine-generating enzyme family protein [Gammaproteobacteria bacterium]|nr:formylglycine-generating enzyme family protein [Gammaproteobacteria bacterium]MCP5425522.1 formylglycine-generating enzyme family protein [Gammaproteobacteria bacterium]MCP5459358.1 formylglycine-generating enzyme family protein [Gammaproteobacteria bacterium]